MKPSFALKLSHAGVSLLRRGKRGWQVIGSVALDDADLNAKLGYLRKTASELAGGALASKLVIPNSEILYCLLDAAGENEAERRAQLAAALEGATPYPVAELVFDWVDAGDGKAHVAAVARKTLKEAENFATEHRFNPVSFVAIPEGDAFVGEPFFGATDLCPTILPDGEKIENDPGPIKIVGDHDPDTAPEPAPSTPAEDRAELAGKTVPPDAGADQDEPDNPGDRMTAKRRAKGAKAAAFATKRRGLQADADAGPGLSRVSARFALYPDKKPTPAATGPGTVPPPVKKLITPMPVTAPDVAGHENAQPPPVVRVPKMARPPRRLPQVKGPVVRPVVPLVANPDLRRPKVGKTIFDEQAPPRRTGKKRIVGLALGLGLAAMVLLAVLLSGMVFDSPVYTAKLWRGFGNSQNNLTVEPLTAPQIVATSIEPSDSVDPVLAVAPVLPVQSGPGQPSVQSDPGAAGPTVVGNLAATDGALDIARLSTPDQPNMPLLALGDSELAESDPNLPLLGEISQEEARVIELSTGVWVLAPIPPVDLEPELLDEFYVASIDPVIIGHDAVALPEIRALNDIRVRQVPSPAPAGTLFDLDGRGFVRPTTQGALSPDGVFVYLGPPAVMPIVRPQTGAANVPEALVAARVSNRRPVLRPANLIEVDERAQLGGRSRAELAAIRPRARPASAQQSGDAADLSPTQLAVDSSRLPVLRGGNFATVVAKSRAATAKASASQTAAIVAAPRVPAAPTTASVAREATLVNAINLSHVNLIGVYGSSDARRALVRLRNGRYLKVQIGDRLDGGKVAAIDGTRLQYIKSGRMLTLEIAS